jgi:DNA-binding MarR family transcriptional regulator
MDDSGDDGTLLLQFITLGAIARRLLDEQLRFKRAGLSALEVALLRYLDLGLALNTPTLARQFGMSRQGMLHLLRELEGRALVEPAFVDPPHPSRFSLTADGALLTSRGREAAAVVERRLVGGASDQLRGDLYAVLLRLLTKARDRPWRIATFVGRD